MADDGYRKDYPQHSRPDSQPRPQSHYPTSLPPPPADKQQRPSPAPQANMATSVTLPSIHDSRAYGPPPPSAPPRGYPSDPRYASPNAVNGYPPPGQQGHAQPSGYPLPPLQPQADPRSPAYPPPDQRGSYYDDRRPHPYGQDQPPQQQYASEQYYPYRQQAAPAPPRPGYPEQRPAYPDYRNLTSGVYEYPPSNAPQLTQAAPRQRTSIACRYCRKRKIRCSGYQSAPGGKCQNCARMNQECIFQPVSSSSSTAFIPVSAVPGGVPPGTQLFGAYGQPLAPGSVPPPPAHAGPYQQHPNQPPPHASYYQQHQQPVQSPTESFSSYGDPRNEDAQVAGRRRRRTSEEQEESRRLPPPRVSGEDDPRRRSPAEFSNHSSPGGLSYPYPGARQSPRNPPGSTLPQVQTSGSYASSAPGGRSPTGQNSSSGASTPARQGQVTGNSNPQKGGTSVMSLSNLVDRNDIDRTMMDRLNRPRDGPTNTNHGSRN
ncbi:Fc.00g035860.m01.CDS01 [Cosmosporella sp. VM-42]